MQSHARQFGPRVDADGVTFRLWAPAARSVDLILDDGPHPERYPMTRRDGWYEVSRAGGRPGLLYRFCIDGEIEVPDPASRFQPRDVAGPSLVTDDAFGWTCAEWQGRPWHEAAFLELHVGTFTPQGTFRAAIDRLATIADMGFTAIELMPVADCPGRWNWGYDGVLLFAPESAYGTPQDLKALIDAAHGHGLMVFLDVVYNHFGPEGNYLGRYAPAFFMSAGTPWGEAIDYRVPEVRRFAVENALYWLEDFRFDGLRLDAVHAIVEPGRALLLRELDEAVVTLAEETGRHIHLVLENDDNCASLLDPQAGARTCLRAQWNDDYHHAWHVALTGESTGYYRDYRDPKALVARALAEGFVYQGEPSAHRGGLPRGERSSHLPATAFVNFLQNHDQIGNRAFGERLRALANDEAVRAATAVMLLSPQIPLLFMGEEDGSTQPFQFFTDYRGALADAVREGRRREFAAFPAFAEPAHRNAIPDPNDLGTFVRSSPGHADNVTWPDADAWRRFYRSALTVRAALVTPHLPGARALGVELLSGNGEPDALVARWRLGDGSTLSIAFNPGSRDAVLLALPVGKIVFETPPRARDRLADRRLPARTCIAWRDGAVNHDALDHRANGRSRP